jgi:hypothetical protein
MKNIHFIFDPQDFGETDLNFIMAIARKHPKAEAYADENGRWYYVSTTKPTKRDIKRIEQHNGIES